MAATKISACSTIFFASEGSTESPLYALVVGNLSNLVRPIQKAAHVSRHWAILDQIVTESPDQAAMGAAKIRFNRRTRCQQSGTGGIEHGVIGAIGCTIHVTKVEQGAGR